MRIPATSLGSARATWVLATLLLASWVAIAATGGPDAWPELYRACGLSRAGVTAGRVWQVASYALLHGSWLHLSLNLLMLLLIGSRIEHILGWRAVIGIFWAGVGGGALAHLALAPGDPAAPILVGASGGLLALLLALTTLSPESRMWPLAVSGKNLGIGLLTASLLLALLHPALGIPGLATAGQALSRWADGLLFKCSHACHLGGGAAGWATARRWLRRPVSREDLLRMRDANDARLAASRDQSPR